jgi:hypothetical protein
MKKLFVLFFTSLLVVNSYAKTRTIHVYVPLCDNKNQGIIPVPESLGNGQDPKNNLYWGAMYGVKSFLKHKTKDWQLVKTLPATHSYILERLLFKHATEDVYLLAEAYDGAYMEICLQNFLEASNGQCPMEVSYLNKKLHFAGASGLLAFTGHDGLMDFNTHVNMRFNSKVAKPKDVIILACYSKHYFSPHIAKAKANPLLWTNSLMAPEAYTLKAAIDGWLKKEDGEAVHERAAQAYNQYQKCGINGARALFASGF